MKTLIMIGGPTASGKTSLSIALAQHYKCPIISADSRQFYREISIGTAKPTSEELSQADHRFINSLSIHDEYSVGDFERQAIAELETIYTKYDHAIMVGGSGLYLRAVAEGIDNFPNVPHSIRDSLQQKWKSEGVTALQEELATVDPHYMAEVDINNPHRLIRALSIIRHTGQPFSQFLKDKKVTRPFQVICIKTDIPRDLLYSKINKRVDQMIKNGLIEEARSVYHHRHLNSLNTVGYKELFNYFDGEYSLEHAIDKIKQHSRNYAKRQVTWFNNQGHWHPVSPDDPTEATAYIMQKKRK